MTSPCPSLVELTAFLAGRLPAGRAEEVRAHLADCEDCYEVVTEVAVLEEEAAAARAASGATVAEATALDGEPIPVPAPRAGKLLAHRVPRGGEPWVRRAAIAATLVLAAGSAAWWWQARHDGVAALYAAASDPRPGTVRLSGAPYQEPEPVLRGGADETPRWKLLAEAERVRERATADPSARNLHALGIAHLLLGEQDAAIEQLERAREADGDDARIASDLGAALIHRGLAADRPEDVAAGLDVLLGKADAAVTLQDRFNRALALERLGLRSEAIEEWERYLALDAASQWAAEARQRLQHLRETTASASEPGPEELEREVLEDLLPRWAESADPEAKAELLESARQRAERYREGHGDASLAEIADAVSVARDDEGASHAILAYRAARRAYRREDIASCRAELARLSAQQITAAAPALASFAAVTDASCSYLAGDLERAVEAARQVLFAARARSNSPVLRGLGAWMVGLVAHSASRPAEALDTYEEAAAAFRQARDHARAARMDSLRAILYTYLGQNGPSWRAGVSALSFVGHAPAKRYQALSWLTQRAALDHRLALAAHAAHAARLEAFRASSASHISDAWRRQASVALLAQNRSAGAHALEQSFIAAQHISDKSLRARAVAQAAVDLATVKVLESPAEAADLASLAADQDAIGAELYLQRAFVHASALEALGRSMEAVEILAAADLRFTNERATLHDPRLRQSLFQRQQSFNDLTLEVLARSPTPDSALRLRDHWRSLELRRPPVDLEARWLASSAREPETVLYAHLALRTELLVWRIANGEKSLHRLTIDRQRLVEVVSEARFAVRRGAVGGQLIESLRSWLLPDLGAQTRVVIVPDTLTSEIPFGALTNSEATGREVLLSPSLDGLTRSRNSPRPGPCVLVVQGAANGGTLFPGLLTLESLTGEAEAVAGSYPCATIASDFEPLRLDGGKRFGVVHYVGHTLAGAEGGFFVLQRGGRIEILPGDAVETPIFLKRTIVLSSCSSAAGPSNNSRGARGLAMNLLAGGAATVVANLWDVEDGNARDFSTALHARIARGANAATAVGEIQRELFRQGQSAKSWAGWLVFR